MTFTNRKFNRVKSFKLTSYNSLNENNETIHQGMGRTLNVSKDGICLETHAPIDTRYKLAMTIGIDDELVDIDGKVVYCNKGNGEMYKSGIEIMEIDSNTLQVLEQSKTGI